MSNDIDGAEEVGMPEVPAGDDVKFSNTGQRVIAILVVLIVIGAAGAAIWWWQGETSKKERYQSVMDDLTLAHRGGWTAFWKETRIPIDELKNNEEFNLRVREIVSTTPVAYGKHIQEKALPVLEKSLERFNALTAAPGELGPMGEEVEKSIRQLLDVWKAFAAEFSGYEDFITANKTLESAGGGWLGAQQDPDNEKFRTRAINYTRLIQCILADSADMADIEPVELGDKIEDTCATNRADWFRRVKADCMPMLNEKNPQPDETYNRVLQAYRKAEMLDHKSVFGIVNCIRDCRQAAEGELIEAIAVPWFEYLKTRNALHQALREKLKS